MEAESQPEAEEEIVLHPVPSHVAAVGDQLLHSTLPKSSRKSHHLRHADAHGQEIARSQGHAPKKGIAQGHGRGKSAGDQGHVRGREIDGQDPKIHIEIHIGTNTNIGADLKKNPTVQDETEKHHSREISGRKRHGKNAIEMIIDYM